MFLMCCHRHCIRQVGNLILQPTLCDSFGRHLKEVAIRRIAVQQVWQGVNEIANETSEQGNMTIITRYMHCWLWVQLYIWLQRHWEKRNSPHSFVFGHCNCLQINIECQRSQETIYVQLQVPRAIAKKLYCHSMSLEQSTVPLFFRLVWCCGCLLVQMPKDMQAASDLCRLWPCKDSRINYRVIRLQASLC